jgi:hypothetical protein
VKSYRRIEMAAAGAAICHRLALAAALAQLAAYKAEAGEGWRNVAWA